MALVYWLVKLAKQCQGIFQGTYGLPLARLSELDHTQGFDSPRSNSAAMRFWLAKAVLGGRGTLAPSYKRILL